MLIWIFYRILSIRRWHCNWNFINFKNEHVSNPFSITLDAFGLWTPTRLVVKKSNLVDLSSASRISAFNWAGVFSLSNRMTCARRLFAALAQAGIPTVPLRPFKDVEEVENSFRPTLNRAWKSHKVDKTVWVLILLWIEMKSWFSHLSVTLG